MKIEKSIKVESSIIEMIQAIYEDYSAKSDLLTSMFEIHKFDDDGSFIQSKPFKAYEKEFAKAKLQYETTMSELRDKYIPDNYKNSQYKFEVNFENNTIDISRN